MNEEQVKQALDRAKEDTLQQQQLLLGVIDEDKREEHTKIVETVLDTMTAHVIDQLNIEINNDDHEHDWRPDGDSWTTRTCDCDFKRGIDRAAHIGKHPDHYKRKRRYTCHCGKSKTIRLKDSGDKQ